MVGGGRGIGRAIALKLASAGASIVVAARTESEWDAVVAKVVACGGQAETRVMNTNLKGPCIRAMLDLPHASKGGQVVNIASKVGLTGHDPVTASTASKAGLIGFSRALAQELSSENIRVAAIRPGPVDTPVRWAATPNMDPN